MAAQRSVVPSMAKRMIAVSAIFIILFPIAPSEALATNPSFDCKAAKAPDEIAICRNEVLSQNDLDTTALFDKLRSVDRSKAITLAKQFLKKRRVCKSSVQCISTAQTEAILLFNGAIEAPSSPMSAGQLVAREQSSGSVRPAGIAWFPGETVSATKGYGDPIISRKGVTPEGFEYAIYQDGSAGLETGVRKWSVSCKADAMTDIRQCSLSSHDDPSLFIDFAAKEQAQALCLLGHDFPGRIGGIRIDKNAAHDTDDQGCLPWASVPEITVGKTITTRSYKWPYDYPVDRSGALLGLNRASELVTFIQNNLEKLSFRH
nr:hypothetical protein [uncultured Rhizobium sp.]